MPVQANEKKSVKNTKNKPLGIKGLMRWFSADGFYNEIIDKRLGLSEVAKRIKKNVEPQKKLHIRTLPGWIALFLFICEVLTGILLMLYYHPTTAEAYRNVRYITNNIHFGWLIRGVHFWGSHLMILFVLLHMVQTFIYGGYKTPRELAWISGVVLLILTLLFGLTGYLLPWNQISYWATTVVTESAAVIPVIGKYLKMIARGGEDVSQVTLSRFYALHVVIVPMLVSIFLIFHLFTIRKYLIPKDLLTHIIIILVIFGLLLSLATLFPAPIHTKADPFNTPANVKPEWYFLAAYSVLTLAGKLEFLGGWAPKLLGVLIQIVFIVFLFIVPFIDTSKIRSPKRRPLSMVFGTLTIVGFLLLTILGKYI